jgi:hypothetical protein
MIKCVDLTIIPTVTQINGERAVIDLNKRGARVRRSRTPQMTVASRASNMAIDKPYQTEVLLALALATKEQKCGEHKLLVKAILSTAMRQYQNSVTADMALRWLLCVSVLVSSSSSSSFF